MFFRIIYTHFVHDHDEECLKFNYSGCGGNENNYDSLLKCKDRCMPTLKPLDMNGWIEQFKVYKN